MMGTGQGGGVQAHRVGKSWRSEFKERPSGREDGRAKIGGLPQRQTPELIPASSRFSGLWLFGLRCRLRCQFSFLLGGELLLDLEADRVHVHLIDGGGIAENLRRVLPGGRVENGDLYQQTAQRSFLGIPQI